MFLVITKKDILNVNSSSNYTEMENTELTCPLPILHPWRTLLSNGSSLFYKAILGFRIFLTQHICSYYQLVDAN